MFYILNRKINNEFNIDCNEMEIQHNPRTVDNMKKICFGWKILKNMYLVEAFQLTLIVKVIAGRMNRM